jgi:hypothetical protein
MPGARRAAIAVGLLLTLGASAMGLTWVVSPATEREEAFGSAPAVVAGYTITTKIAVDRDGVRRETTVTAPGQPKAVQAFHQGRIDAPTLIHELGADVGVRDTRYPDECVRIYTLNANLDITTANDEAGVPETTVLISDSPQSLLNRASGLGVCFPGGMPAVDASGSVEVVVRDYEVLAVSPVSAGSEVRTAEKHYRWTTLDDSQTIAIELRRPALAFLAELPGLSAYSLIPGEAGQFLGTLAYLILAAIPTLLLLWALGVYRRDLDTQARDVAESVVVLAGTLAVAPLLPLLVSPLVGRAVEGLNRLGVSVTAAVGVPIEYEFEAVQGGVYLGGLVVAGVVVAVARFLGNRVLSRLSGLVGRAIVLQLGIMLVGAVALILGAQFGAERAMVRLAVWLVSALLVGAVLTILTSGLVTVATGRFARLLSLRWVAVIPLALWLAVPVEDRIRDFRGESLGEYAYSVNDELFALAASSEILLLVGAIVAAWGLWHRRDHTSGSPLPTWEDAMDDASVVRTGSAVLMVPTAPSGTRSATVIALARAVFAGLLVGKVGVIAGFPVALVIAFLAFPLVFSPLGTTAVLAALATRLRDYRRDLARAILASDADADNAESDSDATLSKTSKSDSGGTADLSKPDKLKGEQAVAVGQAAVKKPSAAVAAWRSGLALSSPPFVPRLAVLSLGPAASPWQNAVRATGYGVLLQLVPLLIYAAFFLPATLSSNDPRIWLDLVSRIATFVAEWAALAFFFGLFYEHLAESTGLRKGLRFGLILLAIALPWRLLAANQGRVSPSVVAFDALELVLFVAALGLLFDLAVLGIDGLQWGRIKAAISSLTSTSGLRPVAIFAGGLLTAAVVAIKSLLEGEISQLISSVLSPFLPVAGG